MVLLLSSSSWQKKQYKSGTKVCIDILLCLENFLQDERNRNNGAGGNNNDRYNGGNDNGDGSPPSINHSSSSEVNTDEDSQRSTTLNSSAESHQPPTECTSASVGGDGFVVRHETLCCIFIPFWPKNLEWWWDSEAAQK